MKRQFIAAGLLLLLTLSGLSSFSGTAAAAGLGVAVARSPLSLPIYVAEDQGYFVAEGAQVTLHDVLGGNRAFQKIVDGEADLATASDTVTMFNSFKSNDFAVITTCTTSNKDVNLIVRKTTEYSRPEHLAGKRIGVIPASASHYYLDSWLIFHGIDPKTIRLVSLQPEAMAAALAKGEVDAVSIWEPFGFEIIKTLPGAKLLPNPGTYTLSFNLLANKKILGSRNDELTKMLRALIRAEQFIQVEPAKAKSILRTRLKLDQDFIDWIWPHTVYRLSLVQSLLTTLESEARWARQEGHVTSAHSPNYLGFIYTEPLRKVEPGRVGIGK